MKNVGRRKVLSIDFDGTLHPYMAGWLGIDHIADEEPVPGAMEFIWEAARIFEVAVFSSRSATAEGRAAMQHYIEKHFRAWAAQRESVAAFAEAFLSEIRYPEHKPAAFVSIDDRAIRFNGIWPKAWTLESYQPWYIKNKKDEPQ